MTDTYDNKVLDAWGPDIDILQDREYSETFTVEVDQYPNIPRLAGRAVVTLLSHDGDGPANLYWDLDPDAAVELAEQLLHNAAIARDFNNQTN